MLFIEASLSIIGPRFTYIIFINSKISIFSIYRYLSSVLDLKIPFIAARYALYRVSVIIKIDIQF